MTYLEDLRSTLHELMTEDDRVVVIGEDLLDPYGGAFKATKGLSDRFGDRVITTPISEAGFTGVGLGLALAGFRPIVEIMFGDFSTLIVDQLVNYASKFPLMYAGVDVPLVVRTPMGGGRGYGPTHSQSLEKLFFGIPGLTVVAPSLYHSPGSLLREAVSRPSPTLFVEHKLLYHEPLRLDDPGLRSTTQDGSVTVSNSTARELDVCIVTYGGGSKLVRDVLDRLAHEEIDAVAVIVATMSPLDMTPITEAMSSAGRLVVVEEGTEGFGFGAEVVSRLVQAKGIEFDAPPIMISAAAGVIPAAKSLEERVLPDVASIERAVYEVLG